MNKLQAYAAHYGTTIFSGGYFPNIFSENGLILMLVLPWLARLSLLLAING